jgi:hypothetical protein
VDVLAPGSRLRGLGGRETELGRELEAGGAGGVERGLPCLECGWETRQRGIRRHEPRARVDIKVVGGEGRSVERAGEGGPVGDTQAGHSGERAGCESV